MRRVILLLGVGTFSSLLASLGSGCTVKSTSSYSSTGTYDASHTPYNDGYGYDASAGASTPPVFNETVRQAKAPPPLSGGTLLVTRDGRTAVAADPDRDLVSVVDLVSQRLTKQYNLTPGDEPGRVIEDGKGRVHVALRGGGALLSFELTTLGEPWRRAICAAPRGLAYDAKSDNLHVACAGGELVTLPSGREDATRTVQLEADLRDVIVYGDSLLVSRFRSAQLLNIGPDGTIRGRYAPPELSRSFSSLVPAVAWRTIPDPNGGAVMVHQLSRRFIDTLGTASYYSSDPCRGVTPVVATAVTTFGSGEPRLSGAIPSAVLPIDIASSADGKYAVIAAGNAHSASLKQLVIFATAPPRDAGTDPGGFHPCVEPDDTQEPTGQATAVAFVDARTVAVQTREPAALELIGLFPSSEHTTITLSTTSREDTGHAIFHSNTGSGVACASCHAEGGDDGLVWTFDADRRRTPSLRGTLGGTEPFHWAGDRRDVPAIVQKVYVDGMSGPSLDDDQQLALRDWLYAIPPPARQIALDPSAAERGRVLFQGSAGCASCHSGPKLTNNLTVDIGTGGAFQVPSLLGVGARAPYLHSGCATTLADRFGPCGGGDKHGKTTGLGSGQIDDLVVYMQTL